MESVSEIKEICKDLFLTPSNQGQFKYTINSIITELGKRNPIYPAIATYEDIKRWSYDHNPPEAPSWVELRSLASKLGLSASDRYPEETWEDAIFRKWYAFDSTSNAEFWLLKSHAVQFLTDEIQRKQNEKLPLFASVNDAIDTLNSANSGLMSSFSPHTMTGKVTRSRLPRLSK